MKTNPWNEMAADKQDTHPDPLQAKLELDFMLRNVRGRVLNVGCGTGYETSRCVDETGYAVGVDYSENMIALARKREANSSAIFRVADALDMKAILDELGPFDTVTTRRMLINLSSWRDQKQAINEMGRMLTPDGQLILIEATEEGYREMNYMRQQLGISEVKVSTFNIPLPREELDVFMERDWRLLEENTMATYYFLTRLFYPTVTEPEYGSHFASKAAFLQEVLGDIITAPGPILMRTYMKLE